MEILLIWTNNFLKCDKDASSVQEDDSWTKWDCQQRDKTQRIKQGCHLEVQWLRIHLHMQETWVPFPVGKLRSHMAQSN